MPRYDTDDHLFDQEAVFVHSRDEVALLKSYRAYGEIDNKGGRVIRLTPDDPQFPGLRLGVDDRLEPGKFYRRTSPPFPFNEELVITRGEHGEGTATVRFPARRIGMAFDKIGTDEELRDHFRQWYMRHPEEIHYRDLGPILDAASAA